DWSRPLRTARRRPCPPPVQTAGRRPAGRRGREPGGRFWTSWIAPCVLSEASAGLLEDAAEQAAHDAVGDRACRLLARGLHHALAALGAEQPLVDRLAHAAFVLLGFPGGLGGRRPGMRGGG